MLRRFDYRKFICIVSILSVVLSLFISFAYANNEDLQVDTTRKMPKKLSGNKEIYKNSSISNLGVVEQELNRKFEEMNDELVLTRTRAFELGNIEIAKMIEKTVNELIIERTRVLQGMKKAIENNTEITKSDFQIQNDQLLELEDKYTRNISHYKDLLNTSYLANSTKLNVEKNVNNSMAALTTPVTPIKISLDTPIDVDIAPNNYNIYEFTSKGFGEYRIYTEYYGGDKKSGSSDTQLSLYGERSYDGVLGYLLQENDDKGNSLFSEVNWSMGPDQDVYIKLEGISGVHARIKIVQMPTTFGKFELNSIYPISLNSYESGFYKFTAPITGEYRMFTGPYGVGSASNDTKLYVFEDDRLTNLLGYNDDYTNGENVYLEFSNLTLNLIGGKTYFIALRGYVEERFNASFSVSADFSEPNDTLETSKEISFNRRYSAKISHTSDRDYYRMIAGSSGTNYISLKVPGTKKYNFIVYNNNQGNLIEIARGLDQGSQVKEASFNTIKGGVYVIMFYGVDGSNNTFDFYNFRVSQDRFDNMYYTINRLETQSYQRGLYQYYIDYEYDKNGNLTNKKVNKWEAN